MTEEKWLATLSTTEPYNNIGLIKLRRNNENSEVMRVRLTKNSKLYDLTALKVFFVTHFIGKDGLKVPIQKEAKVIDAKDGIFEFIFDEDCMQKVGKQEAYFEIYDYDKFLDATQNFIYEIISSSRNMKADFTPYITTWEEAEKMLDEGTAKVLNDKTEKLGIEKANVVDVDEQIRQTNQNTDNKLLKKTDNEIFVAITADMQRQIESTQSGMIGEYNSEAELKNAYPNGTKGYAVVWFNQNGNKIGYTYTYKNSNWVKGQVWNGMGIPEKSIVYEQLADENISLFNIMSGQLSADKILESVPKKKCGKNLFDKRKITKGYYFNGSNLKFEKTTAANCILINVSDYKNKNIVQSHNNSVVVYSKELKPLYGSATDKIITLSDEAHYVGVTIFKGQEDSYQLEEGRFTTLYEKFTDFIDASELKDKSIDRDKLSQHFVEYQPGKNLFNKFNITKDVYVSGTDGRINTAVGYNISEFIEVDNESIYIKSDDEQFAFYSNKDIPSFTHGSTSGSIVKPQKGDKYVRITIKNKNLDTMQLEKGTMITDYEEFGAYIQENQLSPKIIEKLNSEKDFIRFKIQLPTEIYIKKGELFSIYWWNVVKNAELFLKGSYSIRLQEKIENTYTEIGRDLGYKWFWTPVEKGNKNIEIRIFDNVSGEILFNKVIKLIVFDNLISESEKTIQVLGDSFSDLYNTSKYIHNFVTEDVNKRLNMIGLNETGKTGVKDSAWGGYGYQWLVDKDRGYLRSDRPLEDAYWDVGWGENEVNGWKTGQTYTDLSSEQKKHGFTKNEFWNPETKMFDFTYYMNRYMDNAKIDGFVNMYGLNDSVWKSPQKLQAELSMYKVRIDSVINSVKQYDQSIKIMLYLVTPQQINDSYMNSYGGEWLTSGKSKISQEIWNEFILDNYDNRTDENIFVLASNASLDTRYGIIEGSFNPVKYLNEIVEKHTSDVHPSDVGAKQISDSVRNGIEGVIF